MKKVLMLFIGLVLGFLLALVIRPKKSQSTDKVGESRYLMIDDSCCIHLPGCYSLIPIEKEAKIHYVDTSKVYKEDIDWFCPKCIKEKEFEHIQRILERNGRKAKIPIEGF